MSLDKLFFAGLMVIAVLASIAAYFARDERPANHCAKAGGEVYSSGRVWLCLTPDGRIIRDF